MRAGVSAAAAEHAPRPALEGWRRRTLVFGLRLSVLVIVLGAWEIAGRTMGSNLTFPPASAVAVAFVEVIITPELWGAVAETLQAFVLGFALALVSGLMVGLLTARYQVLDRLSALYLRILLTAPLAPLVPLLIGLFGIGLASRVALVFLFSIAVIALNTQTGVRHVDATLVEMATSFGASELTVFRRVRLPGAVPAIMAGVRLGAARAVVGMVVAELIIVSVGLGRLLNIYRGQFAAPEMFAVVIVILLIGVAVLVSVRLVERRLTSWKL